MNFTHLLSAIATTGLGAMLLHTQSGPAIDPLPRPPMPSFPGQTVFRPAAFQAQDLLGLVEIGTLDKGLTIRWSYTSATGRQFHKENFDLDYWPTAASRVSDSRLSEGGDLLVAGKRPSNGHTVIERWNLTLTALPGTTSQTQVQKTTLYDANTVGKKVVRNMNPANSLEGAVYVHFDDSESLYGINSGTGQLTQLLTTSQVPSLGNDSFQTWWGGKLANGAYVYVYQCDFASYDDGATVFYDLDGNGTLDQWSEYAESQWSSVEAIANSFVAHYED